MHRLQTVIAVVTVLVLAMGQLPVLAQSGATIQGTVETPCDPSRVSDIATVVVQPVGGGAPQTFPVDPATGKFVGTGLAAGEYQIVANGTDGAPLSKSATALTLVDGENPVLLQMNPPGCGEEQPEAEEGGKEGGGLKNWQLTLIYVGAVAAAILAVSLSDDDEPPASPM